ncbi:hypothetical protein NPX79_00405 [Spiroplasma endosymbiont of Anurida maritima]|uniref:hypothetical protein n=1 Tax=Spiroplasma endosymbiont of Anurida maritima TaxID=2967972 RepID=UPI0036D2D8DA
MHEVDMFLDELRGYYLKLEAYLEQQDVKIINLQRTIEALKDNNNSLTSKLESVTHQKDIIEEKSYSKSELISRIHDLENKLNNKKD